MRAACIVILFAIACNAKQDPTASQPSPDGNLTLTPSLHEGGLIRLTVKDRSGNVIDDVATRESNLMKWVTGWVNKTSYVFWGADSGTSWIRKIEGPTVTEAPVEGATCEYLEAMFQNKYGERRGNCLKWQPRPE